MCFLVRMFKRKVDPITGKAEMSRIEKDHKKLRAEMDAHSKYPMGEFIMWVNNETDALKLSKAACILNTWAWPDFFPPMPEMTKEERYDYYSPAFHFSFIIQNLCKEKSEKIHPGLHQSVWLSGAFRENAINQI